MAWESRRSLLDKSEREGGALYSNEELGRGAKVKREGENAQSN